MESYELKLVASFCIAALLYAGALNGLNTTLEEAGYTTNQERSRTEESQKQIDVAINELNAALAVK